MKELNNMIVYKNGPPVVFVDTSSNQKEKYLKYLAKSITLTRNIKYDLHFELYRLNIEQQKLKELDNFCKIIVLP